MAKGDIKWTQELRKIVYARLVMEFGPHKSWGTLNYPKGQKGRYNEVMQELASYLSKLTGDKFQPSAVDQQVAWGRTHQKGVIRAGFARQYFMNKAAALEMRFIEGNELVEFVAKRK